MLSKDEAFEILGLKQGANSYEIETRYTLLMKRYRGKQDLESLKDLDRIILAYDILMDRYVEPEPIDPKLQQVVFGKTRYQWRNIWHYRKIPLLITAIIMFFVGSLIYTIATHEDPDFQVVAAGLFTQSSETDQKITEYLQSTLEPVEIVQFQLVPITFEDPEKDTTEEFSAGTDEQLRTGYVMKMVTLITVDTIEMFICDNSVFDQYAPQGAFEDLTILYERLGDLPESFLEQIKPLRREMIQSSEDMNEDEIRSGDELNADTSLPIYGFDVTALDLLDRFDLDGANQILTIGHRAEDPELVATFIEGWIRERAEELTRE